MSGEAEEIDAGRLTQKCPTWGTNHITFGPCLKYHTCAHKSGRVRAPPPICSTHCPHPPSWNKPWVTSEEYLSSLSCVLIWINGTISWNTRITTVDWSDKQMQVTCEKEIYNSHCNRENSVHDLTCTPKTSRVRIPPPICSTHCSHPPSWNKPWITLEEYLSTLSCVLIWLNGAIHRTSGIGTVGWIKVNE